MEEINESQKIIIFGLRKKFLTIFIILSFLLMIHSEKPSFMDQKDLYDLFKRETIKLKIEKIQNESDYLSNIKLDNGDLIIENFNLETKPEEITKILIEKYGFTHDIKDKLFSINISNQIVLHKSDFVNGIDNVRLENAILILRKNKNIQNNSFDFFCLFNKVSGKVVPKKREIKSCFNIIGLNFCSDDKESLVFSSDLEMNYNKENILNYYNVEFLKKIMDSNKLSIFLETAERFDVIQLNNILEKNNDKELDFFIKYGDKKNQNNSEKKKNFTFLSQEIGFLENLVSTLYKYRLYFSENKIEFENLKNKYSELLGGNGFNRSKNTKMQIITGITQNDIEPYLDRMKKKFSIPQERQQEFIAALESTVMASKNMWAYVDFLITNRSGNIKYLAIFSNEDKNNNFNLFISDSLYEFKLGRNILIINKSSTSIGTNISHEIMVEIPEEIDSEKVKNIHKILGENAIRSFSEYLKIDD